MKYDTLVKILDQLREESPAESRIYRPAAEERERLDFARGRAFIHLYLKVKFGLLGFAEREDLITDGTHDGGVDAYYIDAERRVIYFIQSKFRTNERNFEEKQIEIRELLQIDADRITEGHETDESGSAFNEKIRRMVRSIRDVPDIGRFSYSIILLANLKNVPQSDLRMLCGGFCPVQVFNFSRSYKELVFPVASGTFYNVSDLSIQLNLAGKEFSQSRITYPVAAANATCQITIIFVPIIEIARTLHKYKNSILKFNPRSYLDLNTNAVNSEIAKTVTDRTTNEFSLFNNGVTILSDETALNERIGLRDRGILTLKNPQIINGGQTAYTLSRLYADRLSETAQLAIFENKEVMLKIITFDDTAVSPDAKLRLVEEISKTTNQQTAVSEADRRSNDEIQIRLQEWLFEHHGVFYERKRGEFYDGLHSHYINRQQLVSRDTVLRVCYCMKGRPAEARREGEKKLFDKTNFDSLLNSTTEFKRVYLGLRCHELISARIGLPSESDRFRTADFGNALRYGRFAVLTACFRIGGTNLDENLLGQIAEQALNTVLLRWKEFERFALVQPRNAQYFHATTDPVTGTAILETNFDNYYKGRSLNHDILTFGWR